MTALRVIKRPRANLPIPLHAFTGAIGSDVLVQAGSARVRGQLDELHASPEGAALPIIGGGRVLVLARDVDKVVVYS